MTELISSILAALAAEAAQPNVAIAALGALLAGLSRGFSGFGVGLIYMPLASAVLGPKVAVAALFLIDLAIMGGPIIRNAQPANIRALWPIGLGACCLIPVGGWVAAHGDPVTIRSALSIIVFVALALLLAGFRWSFDQAGSKPVCAVVGGCAGFLGGMSGLNGIVLAVYWLGRGAAPALVRNSMFTLSFFTIPVAGATYLLNGMITWHVIRVAFLLAIPYIVGTSTGTRLFHLASPQVFRRIAYGLVFMSGIVGMPLFDGAFHRTVPDVHQTTASVGTIIPR